MVLKHIKLNTTQPYSIFYQKWTYIFTIILLVRKAGLPRPPCWENVVFLAFHLCSFTLCRLYCLCFRFSSGVWGRICRFLIIVFSSTLLAEKQEKIENNWSQILYKSIKDYYFALSKANISTYGRAPKQKKLYFAILELLNSLRLYAYMPALLTSKSLQFYYLPPLHFCCATNSMNLGLFLNNRDECRSPVTYMYRYLWNQSSCQERHQKPQNLIRRSV